MEGAVGPCSGGPSERVAKNICFLVGSEVVFEEEALALDVGPKDLESDRSEVTASFQDQGKINNVEQDISAFSNQVWRL